MKAVLLAGGRGTRLAPLTDTTPKPLVRVLDTPVIEYVFAHLKRLGIREAALTVQYRAEDMRRALGDEVHGVRVHYFEETTPLGTAGAVKAAESFLDEDFLVLSSDALFDFDLSALIRKSEETRALATIAVCERDDVLEYGLVKCAEDGRILNFLEKPSWEGVFSNLVNTGIYACRREILGHLKPDTPADFSRDLFRGLLLEGRELYAVPLEGYWCDIGSPASLYHCNMDALSGAVRLPLAPRGRFVSSGEGRSFVGEGARLLPGARFSASVIGAASEVHAALVTDSVLGHSCRVMDEARVEGALCADAVICARGSFLARGSVVGRGVHLSEGAHTKEGALVRANTVIPASQKAFSPAGEAFSAGVFSSKGDPRSLSQAFFRLSAALAKVYFRGFLLVRSEGGEAKLCADSLEAGYTLCAPRLFSARLDTPAAARYAARLLQLPAGFVSAVKGTSRASLALFDENGLVPETEVIRKVELALRTGASFGEEVFSARDLTEGLAESYRTYLMGCLPDLAGRHITLYPSPEGEHLAAALTKAGASTAFSASPGQGIFLEAEEARLCASVYFDGRLICDADHLRALLLTEAAGREKIFYARSALPGKLEEELGRRGARITYLNNPLIRGQESATRAAAHKDAYLYDPAALLASGLCLWAQKSRTLEEKALLQALRELSPFAMQSGEYVFKKEHSARLLSRLYDCAEESPAGLVFSHEGGTSHLLPERGRIRILSEGADEETARELCDITRKNIEEIEHSLFSSH